MKKVLLATALLATSFGASAATISSLNDNFDSISNSTLNIPSSGLANWDVLNGTVDAISTPNSFGLSCNGGCIDLDGSSRNAGDLVSKSGFSAGLYSLSFDLSGNQRSGTDSLTVSFGDYLQTFTLASNAAWTNILISLVNVNEGDKLTFSHAGGDNIGILLDNVSVSSSVSAVPLPAAAFLFAPALFGFMGFRRKAKKA
ncbi:hypothetical protein LCGC14_0560440 [marine sediment metagenome]|uniref:PEP-CTERM protein-sorting domain-containing protein n=1 Tax=marine sediment metagenome TaxID=412755 RepID=A0A0F9RM03_9ZZZZ|nr:PEP-CTERM sorting domain-containing protein [Methylophaga sp.]